MMKKFLSMAVLALVGAVMMTGCSNDDDSAIDKSQQPGNTSKTVTLTTTVGLDAGATTRALTGGGVKTFAEGEQMAVVYNNGTSAVKAVSRALEAGDITDEGKTASFTFDLETPNTSVDVTYIYPAAMAKADGSVNYDALASQDGTLASLGSNLDLATKTAAWDGTALPSCQLVNQLAILAITLKKHAGDDFTSSITSMTVSDGSNTYAVSRSAAAGPIYVAIRPTADATINVTATNATRTYSKTLTAKTYAASNGYSVSWKMDLPVLDLETYEGSTYTVTEDMVITGTIPLANFQIYTDGNHEITLDNVNGEIYLDFSSSMTIKLQGENRLNHIHCDGDVTIADAGDGTLIAINDGTPLSGNFIIEGGTVKAKATAMGHALGGNLTVNGGAVYLAGSEGERAVDGGVIDSEEAIVYGRNRGSWHPCWYDSQYITTDYNSGNPTDPENSNWNWYPPSPSAQRNCVECTLTNRASPCV